MGDHQEETEYAWFSTGEGRDDFTPVYYLATCADNHDQPRPNITDSWKAVVLSEHLMHRMLTGTKYTECESVPNDAPNVCKIIIDPVCFGASGTPNTFPKLTKQRSWHLRDYFDNLGVSGMSVLASTKRVSLDRCTVVDALGSEWDAVTSGAVHLEDLEGRVDSSFVGTPDHVDHLVSELLESIVQVFVHTVNGQLNMLRLLRAVRVARQVRRHCKTALDEITTDAFCALRIKDDGISTWTIGSGEHQSQWLKAQEVLSSLTAEDPHAKSGQLNIVTTLACEIDERENDAFDLALVLGWIVQTGYWNERELKASLLLDTVYEAEIPMKSPAAKTFLGAFADKVNTWVEEGTLELGPSLKLCIDDVGPISPSTAFDHESPGFLNVSRISESQRVRGIRVASGRGLDLPSSDSVTVRMGGRQRLRVVGGVLVSHGGWRVEKLVSRAELGLSAGVPGLSVGCEVEFSKSSPEKIEEYVVNGIFEGAMGKDAAFWLLGKLRSGDLAVSPETSVCYARESAMRGKKGAPLLDAGLDPKCVQLLYSYTDGKRVYVDFENNGNIREVSIGRDGFMNVRKERDSYEKEEMSECTIVSRRRMR